jgi:hypothetical protein
MSINDYIDQSVSNRHKTTNLRTYLRNIPSTELQPYLDARPVQTKYTVMPIIDQRKEIQTPLVQQPTYNIKSMFNPGNSFSPWSGYASHVNDESELKNQIYALQRSSQAVYVPSSNSDLYNIHWKNNNANTQPFPGLFQKDTLQTTEFPYKSKIGYGMFNNATRQQTKNI